MINARIGTVIEAYRRLVPAGYPIRVAGGDPDRDKCRMVSAHRFGRMPNVPSVA